MGAKLGQVLDQIQFKDTTKVDMSQNPKYDLGRQVLGLIPGLQKCVLNCAPAGRGGAARGRGRGHPAGGRRRGRRRCQPCRAVQRGEEVTS